ncbi:MAG: ABC transporter substrate-binding protein, partial [Mesorhizobium sp.]
SSRRWNTAYNFPAVQAGDVIKKEFKTASPEPMQAFMLNTRRPLFRDRLVRAALTYPLDFESMNRTLFFGSNTRTSSYFQGTELASS